MNQATAAAVAALKLPDEVFYATASAAFDAVTESMAPPLTPPASPGTPDAAVPPIFALGLPRVVDLDHDASIPGALALRYQGLRQWQVDLPQNLCFVIVDLDTNLVKPVSPMLPDKRMATPQPSRSGPMPSPLMQGGTTHGVERVTLPPAFGPDWPASAFAVTVLDYDWKSNTCVVERRPPPAAAAPPVAAPATFLQLAPAGDSVPPGLAIDAPAAVTPNAAIRISGSVHAPRSTVGLALSTDEPDRSVMMATLLLVQLDVSPPLTLRFGVPVDVEGDIVSAAFSFDLAGQFGAGVLGGEYQLYLVSGRSVAGPAALAIKPH